MRGVQLVVPANSLQDATKSYTLSHIYSNDHVNQSSSAFSKYLQLLNFSKLSLFFSVIVN